MDAGGFFPELDNERDKSWFMMDAMKLVNVEAVGVGDRDLRFGFQYLKQTAKSKRLDLVCANLMDKKTRLPALQPWIVKKVGTVNVGFFGLVSDKVDLGPGRDSLSAADPLLAAKKAVTDIRKKGATVVVLLSQLGKVETEDLVTAVDGIDVAIAGRNVPLLPKTRLIKNTVTLYGGEQGQYVGRTVLTLKPDKSVASGDGETFVLGPEVGEKADVGQIVKAFVVLVKGANASDDLARELQDHVKRVTAPYKYPRKIEFVESLPKTISGKIIRKELREREWKGKGAHA